MISSILDYHICFFLFFFKQKTAYEMRIRDWSSDVCSSDLRPFGGMTTEYGKGTAQRTCAAADRTGHAILHTLYQQSLAHKAEFFIEYFALDLIMDEEGACRGVLALDMSEGTLHLFRGHGTVPATGSSAERRVGKEWG